LDCLLAFAAQKAQNPKAAIGVDTTDRMLDFVSNLDTFLSVTYALIKLTRRSEALN
jgi:hypothetical protein